MIAHRYHRLPVFVAVALTLLWGGGAGSPATGLAGSLTRPFVPIAPEAATAAPPPRIGAPSAILVEAKTGTILFEQAARVRRPGASTTKIMTGLLIIERGNLSEEVTISPDSLRTRGTMMRLAPGSKRLLAELLYATLMNSANDAALAAAMHLAGDQETFVGWMNERAATLGLLDTHFANVHGHTALDHYTSAYDLARLTAYALGCWQFAEIVGSREMRYDPPGDEEPVVFLNTNRLLTTYPGATGVKTGTTSRAGDCLVASATRNGVELIAVVLHAKDRYRDASALLDYGFDNYAVRTYGERGDSAGTVRVRHGGKVTAVLGMEARVVVRLVDADRLRWRFLTIGTPTAPLTAGELVGRIDAVFGDEAAAPVLKAFPVVISREVRFRPFILRLLDALREGF
jgi:D-alanyl-D-alanine carboxypeptidase (penicillin-binding protein 5/6)